MSGTLKVWNSGDEVLHADLNGNFALNAAAVVAETDRAMTAESAAQSTAVAAASVLAAHNLGRNRVHNGAFRINQRGYVTGIGISAGFYAHDRWLALAGGSNGEYTFTQTQPNTTITITAGTLSQKIDPVDIEGGSYVLSWIGTATGCIGSGSFGPSPQIATGIAAGASLTIGFTAGTLGQVQLEPGIVATPFEQRPMAVELAICQRFFQTIPYSMRATASAAANFIQTLLFPPMRATPTFVTITAATTLNLTSLNLTPAAPNGLAMLLTSAGAGDSYALNGFGSLSADL